MWWDLPGSDGLVLGMQGRVECFAELAFGQPAVAERLAVIGIPDGADRGPNLL